MFDNRNQQVLDRGHMVMCSCKKHAHTSDTSVLGELSRIADEARGYCLDAPQTLPMGNIGGHGSYGWYPALNSRDRLTNSIAEAKTLDQGLALAKEIAKSFDGTFSSWVPSSQEIIGNWQYANLTIGNVFIRVGVSSGGVVSLDGHPFSPDGKVNVTPVALRAALADLLTKKRNFDGI